jgi:phosphate acetyltransferase
MTRKNSLYLFADCGVQIDPDAKELAEIATLTIRSAKSYGIKPKVAMLSFSTHGSAKHPHVQKVKDATTIAKKKNKNVVIEGEMQFDAAFVPEIRKQKAPESRLKGVPNIFIFPDLQAGNICYKVVQHLSHFDAIGPIVQGLRSPVNDLSRGCNVKEVVLAAAITVLQ